MQNHLSTTDILRATIGTAGALHFNGSAMDVDGSNVVTVATVPPLVITGSGAQTLVAAPGSGKSRNVKTASLVNASSSVTTSVVVERFDGTTAATLIDCTLLPKERVAVGEDGIWRHYDAQGAEYSYTGPTAANLGATGTIAETMARELCPEVNTTAGASGTLFLQAIYLRAGQLVSNITVWSATTAAATTSNLFFALYDGSRNLLAQSANQGAYTWTANTKKTLAMTTAYRVPVSGVYYIGVLQVATTIATLKGGTAKTGGQLAADAPILNGTSNTGLTTTLPNPANAITGGTASIYAAVS